MPPSEFKQVIASELMNLTNVSKGLKTRKYCEIMKKIVVLRGHLKVVRSLSK
jgi:hypothetical protein